MYYREESRTVFLLCQLYYREEVSDLMRRLKNAGKIFRLPLDIVNKLQHQKGEYPQPDEIQEALEKELRRCDAIYLVKGWENNARCRKLYEVARQENKLTLKIKGWDR
jgi:hypothetical protein